MSNPFQPYTSEIVTRLIKMQRGDSRDWFKAIREYLERRSGRSVASVHDYVTAKLKSPADEDERKATLLAVCVALRDENIFLLSPEYAEHD